MAQPAPFSSALSVCSLLTPVPRYWSGDPDLEGYNLATCIWRTREDAALGSLGSDHRRAAAATKDLYAYWKIERYRLIIRNDVDSWDIVDW